MNHCFLSCKKLKHSNLQLPRASCLAVPPIQRLIQKERGSELHSSCVVMVVSDGLRSSLMYGLNFKIFLGEHALSPPTTLHYTRTDNCTLRKRRPTPHSIYIRSPFLQSLDPPLKHTYKFMSLPCSQAEQ